LTKLKILEIFRRHISEGSSSSQRQIPMDSITKELHENLKNLNDIELANSTEYQNVVKLISELRENKEIPNYRISKKRKEISENAVCKKQHTIQSIESAILNLLREKPCSLTREDIIEKVSESHGARTALKQIFPKLRREGKIYSTPKRGFKYPLYYSCRKS
jgi:ribosomal protein L7Ae-like RNA K-turn-binding protein